MLEEDADNENVAEVEPGEGERQRVREGLTYRHQT